MHCSTQAKNSFFSASTGVEARHIIRAGAWTDHTSGVAPDFVQANIVILPEKLANDFLRFCQRNPKPCPLLAVSEPGNPGLPRLGADLDIRPMSRVIASGAMADKPMSAPTFRRCGVTIWSLLPLAAPFPLNSP